MFDVSNFVSALSNQGVTLWIDDGQLRYRAAQGVLSPEQVGLLRQHKQEVMSFLTNVGSVRFGISPQRFADAAVPATIQQEWSLELHKDAKIDTNLVAYSLRLRGVLNLDCLGRSIGAVLRRHSALRTQIVFCDGKFVQNVNEPCEYQLSLVDLTGEPAGDSEAEARRLIINLFRTQLNLAVDPLFQAKLIRVAENEYLLAIAIHHLVTDGVSGGIIFRELWGLYADLVTGREPSLSIVPTQYADYARWQRSILSRWLIDNRAYWQNKLSGVVPVRLPRDLRRGDVKSYRTATFTISFDGELSVALHALSRFMKVNPAIIMLSLYSILLSRLYDQKDLVVSFNVVGRHLSEHLNTVGYFAHPLILKIEYIGNEQFDKFVKKVFDEFVTANNHLDFGNVISELPDVLNAPFFQYFSSQSPSFFGLPDLLAAQSLADSLSVELFQVELDDSGDIIMPVDIGLGVSERAGRIWGHGAYRADLFSPDTMRRLVEELHLLAGKVVRDPQTHIL
jgi:NRPS condensation-like uncharacterized protein